MFFSRISSYFQSLFSNPIAFILQVIAVITSLILHECAHGYVALKCGDPTAKYMGRLTMDPRKHLDLMGTICMIFLGFGWAKPVPVNPNNFKNYRRDDLLVSLAGVTTNMILCIISVFLYVLTYKISGKSTFLDYLRIFLSSMAGINVVLAIFNLLPIPPLDGYHVFNDIIFRGRFQLSRQGFQIAQIVLIVFCMTGALSGMLGSVRSWVLNGLLNLFVSMLL